MAEEEDAWALGAVYEVEQDGIWLKATLASLNDDGSLTFTTAEGASINLGATQSVDRVRYPDDAEPEQEQEPGDLDAPTPAAELAPPPTEFPPPAPPAEADLVVAAEDALLALAARAAGDPVVEEDVEPIAPPAPAFESTPPPASGPELAAAVAALQAQLEIEGRTRAELEDMLIRIEKHFKAEQVSRRTAEEEAAKERSARSAAEEQLAAERDERHRAQEEAGWRTADSAKAAEGLASAEAALAAARADAARAQEAMRLMPGGDASLAAERARVESEYRPRVSALEAEVVRLNKEMAHRTAVMGSEMERWMHQAEVVTKAVREAKDEVQLRKAELDSTKAKMDVLVDKLYAGREKVLELRGTIDSSLQWQAQNWGLPGAPPRPKPRQAVAADGGRDGGRGRPVVNEAEAFRKEKAERDVKLPPIKQAPAAAEPPRGGPRARASAASAAAAQQAPHPPAEAPRARGGRVAGPSPGPPPPAPAGRTTGAKKTGAASVPAFPAGALQAAAQGNYYGGAPGPSDWPGYGGAPQPPSDYADPGAALQQQMMAMHAYLQQQQAQYGPPVGFGAGAHAGLVIEPAPASDLPAYMQPPARGAAPKGADGKAKGNKARGAAAMDPWSKVPQRGGK